MTSVKWGVRVFFFTQPERRTIHGREENGRRFDGV